MGTHGILAWILIGAVAGWLAGKIMSGTGYGLFGDIAIGIVGAFFGGWLGGRLGLNIGGGLIASIITATVGAIILLFLFKLVRRA